MSPMDERQTYGHAIVHHNACNAPQEPIEAGGHDAPKQNGLAPVNAKLMGIDDTQMTQPSGSTSKAHGGTTVPIC